MKNFYCYLAVIISTSFLILSTGAYGQLCTGSLGDPVLNITFGNGNNPGQPLSTIVPGATTTYPFISVTGNPATPIVYDGQYTITNNVISHPAWFSGALDHTLNDINGYMAFFNASELPGEFYKQTIQGLCENTTYEFAAWVANVLNPSALVGVKPNITFVVQKTDGTTLATYSTGGINQRSTLTWEQFGFFFSTPSGVSTVILKIINTNVGGNAQPGNDFAIDDITFKPCGPKIFSSFSSNSNQITKTQCGFAPVPLYGTASSGFNSPGYLWQISNNNGVTWADIPSSNNIAINYTPTLTGIFSFRILSGEGTNINSPICRVVSNLITLTITAPPQISFLGNTICPGQQGQLQFSITGSGNTYNVVLNNGTTNINLNSITANSIINIIPAPTVSTTYTVVSITGVAGCIRSSGFTTPSATITVQPLAISINSSTTICPGDSIQLNATGGIQYAWSPSGGLSNSSSPNPKASPANTITYKVIITGSTGCKDSATTLITVNPKPTLTLSPPTSICIKDSTILSATGAAIYTWSPSLGLSNAAIANPVAAINATTTYTVSGTGVNGCVTKDSVTITAKPKPLIVSTADTSFCENGLLQLMASGGQQYVWRPITGLSNAAIVNPVATINASVSYIVQGIGANGCKATDTTVINMSSKPVLILSNDTSICSGLSYQLIASGAAQYQWSPAAGLTAANIANPVASIDTSISYLVTGTSAAGCTSTKSIQLTALAKPVLVASGDTSVCPQKVVQLNVSGAQNYLWSPANGLSGISISNPLAVVDSTIIYTVTANGANGCIASKTITLSALARPNVQVNNDTSVCSGGTLMLTATGAQQYVWSPATGLNNSTLSTAIATILGDIKYTVSGTGANGCVAKDSISIAMLAKPNLTATADTSVCENKALQLFVSGANQYNWSPATGLNNAAIANPVTTLLNGINYIVTGTAINGCTASRTVSIGTKPAPVITLSADTIICKNRSATLFAAGASQYVWSPQTGLNNPTSSTPIASPAATTVYYLTGTGINGCEAKDSVTVAVKAAPVFAVSPVNGSVCTGNQIQLMASGGDSYLWRPASTLSDPFIANPVARPVITTVYSVLIKDSICNIDIVLAIPVVINATPAINIIKDNDITCSQPFTQLRVSGANNYRWTPATGLSNAFIANPVATILATTKYYVEGISAEGCTTKDSIIIKFENSGDLSSLLLPSAFTPNGDGRNDCFGIKKWGNVDVSQFKIFNRWGEVIFTGKSASDCWDGKYKSVPQQTGAFVYILMVKTPCGLVERRGTIVLIR